MRILAIETASEACSVAVFDGSRMIARDHRLLGRGHAEMLVPMIAALPQKGRADRILVSLGPGSFTGVRIGLATARALGVAWGVEVLGYPTLALIAAMAQAEYRRASLSVCVSGGHGEWFVQDFDADGLPQGEAVSKTPDAARQQFRFNIAAGNRAVELVGSANPDQCALNLLPDAASVLLVPQPLLTPACVPIYGRAPDATPQTRAAAT